MTESARNTIIGGLIMAGIIGVACLVISTQDAVAQATVGSIPIRGSAQTATFGTGFSVDQNIVAAASNLRLMGWSVRESAGSAAVAAGTLRDSPGGAGACTGNVLATIGLVASDGQVMAIPQGIPAAGGVCFDRTGGTVDIVVYTYVQP